MSLLIVRCPLKPFAGANSNLPNAWQELECAARFQWCLIDGVGDPEGASFEFSTTESMPYADEALVLMPTLDVRLIEVKVPLASDKKLQQILPNLIEDYVLSGAENLTVQAFPPVPGNLALERVLALIYRTWFDWLTKQLEGILSPRVRLIPEALVLPLSSDLDSPSIFCERAFGNVIFTWRTKDQLGVSWAQHEFADDENLHGTLPSVLANASLTALSCQLLIEGVQEYLRLNNNSRSPNFALNLLPKTFKPNGKSIGLATLALFKEALSYKGSPGLGWTDPLVWRQSIFWLGCCATVMAFGFGVQLSYLAFVNWSWNHQMELLAVRSLTPESIAIINQAQPQGANSFSSKVLKVFTGQVSQAQRRQGAMTDADFGPMAAKLEQLKTIYGAEVLQRIEYDGNAMDFEFKPTGMAIDPQALINRARNLGMAVRHLGLNRYRLEPFAGLGDDL